MAEHTGIDWTDHTFNPWWGCERVSPACAHCYAATLAARYEGPGLWAPKNHGFRFFSDKHWNEPRVWNRKAEKNGRPELVFCASMADVFEARLELEEPRARLWELITETPWLTWQLLTKRPENIEPMVPDGWLDGFPPNVWVGTSIENTRWTHRAEQLREIPAFRFLSCEPLLGSLFSKVARNGAPLNLDGIGWVIGGGESGPGHRPTQLVWAKELLIASKHRGIPFFWKQWGGARSKSGGKAIEGEEWCEIPQLQDPALALF